jgi:hypothetical protein
MEVSGQLHTPDRFSQKKEPPRPIEYEPEWVPEFSRPYGEEVNPFVLAGNRTTIPLLFSP